MEVSDTSNDLSRPEMLAPAQSRGRGDVLDSGRSSPAADEDALVVSDLRPGAGDVCARTRTQEVEACPGIIYSLWFLSPGGHRSFLRRLRRTDDHLRGFKQPHQGTNGFWGQQTRVHYPLKRSRWPPVVDQVIRPPSSCETLIVL